MTQQTDDPPRSYEEVRAARKAKRKADRARKKANKPKGIDLPFRKSMPRPLLVAFGVVALATLALVVVVVISPPAPHIALAARRSPPGQLLSHDVGSIVLANTPAVIPATESPCPAFNGIVIEGGPPAQVRLGSVLRVLCPFAVGDGVLARSLRALSKARIHFATFARTGDPSTLSYQEPVRVLINISFAQRNVFVDYIGPLLAHEGFHLLNVAKPLTAEMEYDARDVELQACRALMTDPGSWPRGCTDAQQIIDFGRARAVKELIAAGFPKE